MLGEENADPRRGGVEEAAEAGLRLELDGACEPVVTDLLERVDGPEPRDHHAPRHEGDGDTDEHEAEQDKDDHDITSDFDLDDSLDHERSRDGPERGEGEDDLAPGRRQQRVQVVRVLELQDAR